MLLMAKRKPGRPKSGPSVKAVLHIEVPPELKDAVERLAERNQRKITGEVIVALQKHLQDSGVWPPSN